jgi:hypothetical protein
MAKDSVSFTKFSGIRNTVTEERLSMGGRDASGRVLGADLVEALNVDIDDAGQIRRRRGRRKVADGVFHSLWSADGLTYVVKDANICRLYADYTTKVLQFGVGPDRLSYVKVGDSVYFSSRSHSGVIDTKTDQVRNWGYLEQDGPSRWLSPVVNPTDSLPAVRGKLLGAPPNATSLAYFNGRIYLASGRTLWATELYLYDYVDKTRTYIMFEADITGVIAVVDGLYVGTAEAVYFLTGAFGQMSRVKVAESGMVAGSAVALPPDVIRGESSTRSGVMFMTRHGVFIGRDGGSTVNLTQSRVEFPSAVRAAPMYRLQDGMNQYVAVADSAGGPVAASRIGDFVDVEIRRFKGA